MLGQWCNSVEDCQNLVLDDSSTLQKMICWCKCSKGEIHTQRVVFGFRLDRLHQSHRRNIFHQNKRSNMVQTFFAELRPDPLRCFEGVEVPQSGTVKPESSIEKTVWRTCRNSNKGGYIYIKYLFTNEMDNDIIWYGHFWVPPPAVYCKPFYAIYSSILCMTGFDPCEVESAQGLSWPGLRRRW